MKLNSVHVLCTLVSLSAGTVQCAKAEGGVNALSSLNMISEKASGEPTLFNLSGEPPLPDVAISPKVYTVPHPILVRHHSLAAVKTCSVANVPASTYSKDAVETARKLIEKLQQQLAEETRQAKKDSEERAGLAAIVEQKQQSVDELQNKLAGLSQNTQEIANLRQSLFDSKQTNQNLKEQLDDMKTHSADAANSSFDKVKQLEKERVDTQATLARLQQQVLGMSMKLKEKDRLLANQKQQLDDATGHINTVEIALAKVNAQVKEKDSLLASQKQQLDDITRHVKTVETSLADANTQSNDKSTQLIKLSETKSENITPAPDTETAIRDYALGAYWAQEMMGMIHEKEVYGYTIDNQQVLSGARDKMNNALRIPEQKLITTLNALYAESKKKEEKVKRNSDNQGRVFMQTFSKQPGVKHDMSGYYYLIAEKGEGKFTATDKVAVVIRESLTNGKVINDMLEKHSVLSLPLNQFPPLFKSAISHARNHGEIRIVVPPELAYGDKGRLPDIPPDSTMIYDIKVIDARKPTDS